MNPFIIDILDPIVSKWRKTKKKEEYGCSDFRIYLLMGKNIDDELSTNRVMKTMLILKKRRMVIRLENNNFKDLPFSEKGKYLPIGETWYIGS